MGENIIAERKVLIRKGERRISKERIGWIWEGLFQWNDGRSNSIYIIIIFNIN